MSADELALYALIEDSITARYSGDLERNEDLSGECSDTYVPSDTDHIRELLTSLWGEHVTALTLDHVFNTLITDGWWTTAARVRARYLLRTMPKAIFRRGTRANTPD